MVKPQRCSTIADVRDRRTASAQGWRVIGHDGTVYEASFESNAQAWRWIDVHGNNALEIRRDRIANAIRMIALLQFVACETADGSEQRRRLAQILKGVSDTDLSLAKQGSVG